MELTPASRGDARRVPPMAAFLEGWRRVWQTPALLLGTAAALWCASLLLAAALQPAAPWLVAYLVPTPAGPAWLYRFYVELRNLADVLAPELAPFMQPSSLPRPLVAGAAFRVLLWMFISGGVLDRLARGRPIRTAGFFAACGVYFVRFLRLAALLLLPAYAVLRVQWAFGGSLTIQLAALALLAMAGAVIDFAKVRAVVEDRHSMIGAIAASLRFIRRRLIRVAALMLLNGVALLAVLRIEFQVGATPASPWLTVAMGAGTIAVATFARLAMLASEIVFFQGELAHAGYTAAPPIVWPDSPAVEAIENLRQRPTTSQSL